MKKIKLGIIGLGLFFQKTHLPALTALKDRFSVVGIHTSSLGKFQRIIKYFPSAQYHSRIGKLLSDPTIDAVVACVPIPEHYRIARKVIASGKALLLEKPMAANIHQAKELVHMAQSRHVPLMIAESFPYFEHFRYLKSLLKKKALGRIEFVQVQAIKKFDEDNPYYKTRWRVGPKGYPGILWDAGIHAVSLLRFLFGSIHVPYTYRRSYNKAVGQHDTVLAHVRFAGKTDGAFLMSYSLFGQEPYFLTVYCAKGRIKCGINALMIERGGKAAVYNASHAVYPQIYKDFYQLVHKKRKPFYTMHDAFEDLKALEALVNK